MACGFAGLRLQAAVGRLYASWRLGDDELPSNRNKLSKSNSSRTTLTTVSPSRKTRTSLTTTTITLPRPQTATANNKTKEDDVFQLLNATVLSSASLAVAQPQQGQPQNLYMGYETWLPVAPKVNKPRTIYNAETLAYVGDCIYELYARRHFLFPPLSIDEYNGRVMAVVRCEAQDALLKKLQKDGFLTEEERDVVRWGKNVQSGKSKAVKRVGVSTYKRASSLETLIGYLYLTHPDRLKQIMLKMGFSNGASRGRIAD